MTVVVIIGLIIFIVLLANTKSKPPVSKPAPNRLTPLTNSKSLPTPATKPKPTPEKFNPSAKVPSPEGFDFAIKHFGGDWLKFLAEKKANVNLPHGFQNIVAFAYQDLHPSDKKELLISFLDFKVSSEKETSSKSVLTIGLTSNDNELHTGVLNLLQQSNLSEQSVSSLMVGLVNKKRQERMERDKKKQEKIEQERNIKEDESIIMVSGQPEKLDIPLKPAPIQTTPTYIPPPVVQAQYNTYSYGGYNPDEYKLGTKYKDKLSLSDEEVKWLNKFWNPSNVFLSIESCCIATVKFYIAVIKEFTEKISKIDNAKTFTKELEYFKEEGLKAQREASTTRYYDSNDNSYIKNSIESDIFSTIFKRSENGVREFYKHSRKISPAIPFTYTLLLSEFELRIGDPIAQIIKDLSPNINLPDEETQIALNFHNPARWKIEFEELTNSFVAADKDEFIDKVYELEKVNKKNPNIESIFFEASKFIAKVDRVESLKFYVNYLYYDLKSNKIDNKKFTKTIQKSLFKTNQQLNDFEKIVSELLQSKNRKKAISEVEKVFGTHRKKIKLDKAAIKEVQQQHSGTVELLNEYLKDEFTDENTVIKSEEINKDEIKIVITQTTIQNTNPYNQEISFTEIQTETIVLFKNNSFFVSLIEMETFSKSKGVFKNQLIESINETCYEYLDDIIIEEEEEKYCLNETYYQKIIKV